MSEETSVLVVGAGPVGLTLATECRRFGLPCMIIDKATERQPWSKALGVAARTMEVFDLMGVLPAIEKRPRESAGVFTIHLGPDDGDVVRIDGFDAISDTRHKQITILPQCDTEAVLEERLKALGGNLERGWELVGMVQRPDNHVEVKLKGTSDGSERMVVCKYVVGCDGAHSNTRKLLGLTFQGQTYPQRLVIGDFEVRSGAPEGVHVFSYNGRAFLAIPLRAGSLRFVLTRPDDAKDADAQPRAEEVEAMVHKFLPNLRLGELQWLSLFKISRRTVESYRKGSVFVAGDAAHIHSPGGGQGMNLGIGDAFNLAWKLAVVELKGATPRLLDTYDLERRPLGMQVVGVTDTLTKALLESSQIAQLIRRAIVAPLLRVNAVRHALIVTMTQLRHNYRHSPLVKEVSWVWWSGPRAGDRVPDYPLKKVESAPPKASTGKKVSTLDVINNGVRHTLLVFGTTPSALRASAEWSPLFSEHADVMTAVVVLPSSFSHHAGVKEGCIVGGQAVDVVVDDDQEVYRAMGVGPGGSCVYLVRPDGYVAYRAKGTRAAPLRAYLHTVFNSTR